MALKALIFAGNHKIYSNYIKEYQLNILECKYVQSIQDIQGYSKETNPDLLLIFLDYWEETPAGLSDQLAAIMIEFKEEVHVGGEVAARLMQLTHIIYQEQLPEYLTHENERVRTAALKRQQELMDDKHFTTAATKKESTETKIVENPPVKITRASSGSRGKDTEEELIEKPEDDDWLKFEDLNDPSIQQGMQTGYYRWVKQIGDPLERINSAEDASQLPEMLASKFPEIQEEAKDKLGELKDKSKLKLELESRFDIIDIPDGEEEEKE